jgi:SAM-dependent methyltransferase
MRYGDRILRLVYRDATERAKSLLSSALVQELQAERLLPKTRSLGSNEIADLRSAGVFTDVPGVDGSELVLEHERIPFPSYAYEWCPEMLFAAGELTLNLQLRALDAGLTLKDATPTNVLFRGAQPVFVDYLSFAPRPLGGAIWPAYAQFVRTFLLPLLLFRQQKAPINELFFGRRDGLDPLEVYTRISIWSRFRPVALQFVSLPAWIGRTKTAQSALPGPAKQSADPKRDAYIARTIAVQLRGAFRLLKPKLAEDSVWADYMETHSYADESFVTKRAFVRDALRELSPRTVLDVGCNTGYFSCLAAAQGASVVAIDNDPAVISKLWLRSRAEHLPILPLVLDFGRPSPGLGWRNAEKLSFLDRARRHFDAALLLAVLHHLTVTEGIPLRDIFELCAQLVTGGLIVEYVPAEDLMFRKISRNKEHLIPRLGQAEFEASYAPWFALVRRQQLPNSSRWMYLLRRQRGTSFPVI